MRTWSRPTAGALMVGALALGAAVPAAAADRWGLCVGEWTPASTSASTTKTTGSPDAGTRGDFAYAASPFSRHRTVLVGGGGANA